jgi:hypothetical protein
LPQLVEDLGPIFGLVSFAVFATLLVLYIVRARQIRQLRKAAPFLAENNGNPETTPPHSRGTGERQGPVAR